MEIKEFSSEYVGKIVRFRGNYGAFDFVVASVTVDKRGHECLVGTPIERRTGKILKSISVLLWARYVMVID